MYIIFYYLYQTTFTDTISDEIVIPIARSQILNTTNFPVFMTASVYIHVSVLPYKHFGNRKWYWNACQFDPHGHQDRPLPTIF